VDILTPKERSQRMALIRARDTKVEMVVRRLVHKMGYRYRLYYQKLPGKPDLAFPVRHKVIFIHGCFWHGHKGCAKFRLPKSRLKYWLPKIRRNQQRDKDCIEKLQHSNWSVLIIWECELPALPSLAVRIKKFLGPERSAKKAFL